jgi:hypothetical protein
MKKKILYTLLLIAALIVAAAVWGWLAKKNAGEPMTDNKPAVGNTKSQDTSGDEHNYPPSTAKTGDAKSQGVVGTLGGKECMEKFTIERGVTIPEQNLPQTGLEVASLETFRGGAFYGKIKNYSPDDNYQLTELIDKL